MTVIEENKTRYIYYLSGAREVITPHIKCLLLYIHSL